MLEGRKHLMLHEESIDLVTAKFDGVVRVGEDDDEEETTLPPVPWSRQNSITGE